LSRKKEGLLETGRFEERRATWSLFAALALMALLAAVSCGSGGGGQRGEGPSGGEQAVANLENPSLGEEDAPVVLVEYSDLQ
jgi:hypothetical protein